MRVLVADDDPDIARMLDVLLTMRGVEATTWTSNFAGLLEPEPWAGIDVALLDLMLPEVDGEAIARYLAAHHPGIRRVVLSAVAHQRPGLSDIAVCMSKPTDAESILQALGVRDGA